MWRELDETPGRARRRARRHPCAGAASPRRRFRAAFAALSLACLGLACSLSSPPAARAALLAERGREHEAILLLERHLSEHPEADSERRLLIRLYGSVGRTDLARAQTERLARILPPGSPTPWIELGHALELSHDYEGALQAYDQAAAVAPRDAAGPKRAGLRAARWGELRLAESRLSEAVTRDPEDPESWHALGLVRAGLGDLEGARGAYERGLAVDAEALENRLGLATVALRASRPEEALRQYDAIIAARPARPDAWLGRSWCLVSLGRLAEAEAALRSAESRAGDPEVIARQRAAIESRRARERGSPLPSPPERTD